MGQGAWSGLAQIAADEVGADWRAVGVEPAPLGPAYANPALFDDQLAGMPAALRGLARWGAGKFTEVLEFQITGGSTSIRGFEAPLRHAGAAARAMLCSAAARRWNVSAGECDTRDGFVTYKANRLAFADVVGDVRPSDAPSRPALRSAPTLVGKPVLRLDVPAKTDGSARYGADVRLDGMRYAAISQGPIGAKRTGIDKAALPARTRLVEMPDFVAVVADGWFAAKSALDSLTIRYAPGPNPPGPWLEAGLKAALDGDGRTVASEGTLPRTGLAVTADYTLPFLAHACLEPMTATARLANGGCEIWAPTQSASITRWSVARALGIDADKVMVYPTLVGGGFGRKVEADAAVQAALIARAAGQPVQLIWSREEDFAHDFWRPAVAARLRGAATPSAITAWDAHFAVPDVGSDFQTRNLPAFASSPKPGAGAIEGATELPYAIDTLHVVHSLGACNVPLGFWRSVGHSFTGFVVESFVDELAASAAVDPGEFRLALLKDNPRHAAVLRAVLQAGGPLGKVVGGPESGGRAIGRGVALVESFGSIVAEVAEVLLVPGEAPRVTRVWAAVDCGRVINPDTVRAQIEGGIIYGLTAALFGRASFVGGAADQRNFDGYPLLDLASTPVIEVTILPSNESPGGIGEPGTPPIAAAVANAIAAAGGDRPRALPIVKA